MRAHPIVFGLLLLLATSGCLTWSTDWTPDDDDDATDPDDDTTGPDDDDTTGPDDDDTTDPDDDDTTEPPDDADGDGWTVADGDCDDNDPDVHPGVDEDGDGVGPCEDDCDDTRPDIGPGFSEACDNRDNDCDGAVDEDFGPITIIGRGDLSVASAAAEPLEDWGWCAPIIAVEELDPNADLTASKAIVVVSNVHDGDLSWPGEIAPLTDAALAGSSAFILMGTGGWVGFTEATPFDGAFTLGNDFASFGGRAIVATPSNVIWQEPSQLLSPTAPQNSVELAVYANIAAPARYYASDEFDVSVEAFDEDSGGGSLVVDWSLGLEVWLWAWEPPLSEAQPLGQALFVNLLWNTAGPPTPPPGGAAR